MPIKLVLPLISRGIASKVAGLFKIDGRLE
jgi:hypothetical protein